MSFPLLTCPETGIRYVSTCPAGEPQHAAGVVFLNGIGLDHEGFHDALSALHQPLYLSRHPYATWHHLAITVPGFEDALERLAGPILGMEEQAEVVARFILALVASGQMEKLVLYGFSFGSDLAVEVLEHLKRHQPPLRRVVLAEMNVHKESCFITSRITASYEAATDLGHGRHQQAYSGFVSRILRAYTEGAFSASVMQDMTRYFHTIARKDWHQLARSAREASEDPESRVQRLLSLCPDFPDTDFELVFSDPRDLKTMRAHQASWYVPLTNVRVLDATGYGHFHHMSRSGVLDNLRGLRLG